MDEDNLLPFSLPAICRKKVSVAFDGGLLSSDGGVMLLRDVERRVGLAARLGRCLTDRRDPARIDHALIEMLRLRMFLIAAGYEDADDCDSLRADPVFKMAVGRLPESGNALCSQPTMSRLENAPSKIEIARMMAAMVNLFCASWARPPAEITLDIDDTLDRVHGHQQLSLFNAYYDERCFLPIHICMGLLTSSTEFVAVLLFFLDASMPGACPQASADQPSGAKRRWPVDRRKLCTGRPEGSSPTGADYRATYLYSADPRIQTMMQ
jgi:hypothetical protein